VINEHNRIVLTVDLPTSGLQAGDVGTVVHIYQSGKAYEVEFMTLLGETIDVVEVSPGQIRPVQENEIANARKVVMSH